RPFQEGKEEFPPHIGQYHGDEFNKLASALNFLTNRLQKQIENLTHQREETGVILESLGEGIIATDTSAQITFVNRTACKMLGVSREALLSHLLIKVDSKALRATLPASCMPS